MTWNEWYDSLAKPSWTPAPSTISLIWTILYPVILTSFGFVFVQAFRKKLPGAVALPFAVNLVANLLFMPIFAGLRNVRRTSSSCGPRSSGASSPCGRTPDGLQSPKGHTSCGCRLRPCCNCRSRR
jgi:hypothetical protein